MRLPETAHTDRPWRIHELTDDFRLEDVWALRTPGGPDDFPRLLRRISASTFPAGASALVRLMWQARVRVGAVLGWDRPDAGRGLGTPSLRDRLPEDLRAQRPAHEVDPFAVLYETDDEWAGELVNRTVHAVMHLGWVPDGEGGHRGQLAVLVRPVGVLGEVYMAAIKPFRHLLVYPALLREIEGAGLAGRADGPRRS